MEVACLGRFACGERGRSLPTGGTQSGDCRGKKNLVALQIVSPSPALGHWASTQDP